MNFPLRFVLLAAAVGLLPASAQARLGEDEAALKKRYGEGRAVAEADRPGIDMGLWRLFDQVLVFEKGELLITAGLADGKCEAIAYQPLPTAGKDASETQTDKKEKKPPVPMITWYDMKTLLARNAGESSFDHRYSAGDEYWFVRQDQGGVAKVEGAFPRGATRVIVASGALFSGYEAMRDGNLQSEFLRRHSSKELEGF